MISTPFSSGLRRFLRHFHRSESGTAMTEFAITLPVYIVFLLGISSLTTVHHEVLDSKKDASANLWENAVSTQTGTSWPVEMTPISGFIAANTSYYMQIEDYARHPLHYGFQGIDSLASVTGMYPELGAKSILGQPYNNIDPKFTLGEILCTPSHAHTLNNDLMSFSGGGDIFSTILNVLGARPGIAAGINYGVSSGIDSRSFQYPGFGMTGEVQSHYVASVPTRPSPHVFGVGLTYLELRTEDAYRDVTRIGWSHMFTSVGNGCTGSGGGGSSDGSTQNIYDPDGNVVGSTTCDGEGNCETIITDDDFADEMPDNWP